MTRVASKRQEQAEDDNTMQNGRGKVVTFLGKIEVGFVNLAILLSTFEVGCGKLVILLGN